jgi:hypothetical protein
MPSVKSTKYSFFRFKILWLVSFVVLFLSVNQPVQAGWILTGTYIDTEGKAMPQRFFIENNKFKYEMHDFIYIFDFNTKGLILINIDKLTYCKTTLDAYLSFKRSLMAKRLDEMLKSVPENEQNKWKEEYSKKIDLEGTIPAQNGDSVTINDTKIDFKMMNFDTDKYAVSVNGLRVEEVWIAPTLKMETDFNWANYFDFMAALSLREGDVKLMTSKPYEALLSTGYPLRRIMYTQLGTNEWQVNLIEKKNIPDYEFYTPALCKSVTLQQWFSQPVEKVSDYDDYE